MFDLAELLERALVIITAVACTAFIVSLVWVSRSFVEPNRPHPEEEPAPRWRLGG
jgi:hypothetical protein